MADDTAYTQTDELACGRRTLDGPLEDLPAFLDETYGVREVDGDDYSDAVVTNRGFETSFHLDDARIDVSTGFDDDVSITVAAVDDTTLDDIRTTLQQKIAGEYGGGTWHGLPYTGTLKQDGRKERYRTTEPMVGAEAALQDYFHDADITLTPIADDIDRREDGIRTAGHDDAEYLAEATLAISRGDEDAQLHITQQKSFGDADIEFRVHGDDPLEKEIHRLMHGRFLSHLYRDGSDEDGDPDIARFIVDDIDTRLDDIGGLEDVKAGIIRDLINPINHPEKAEEVGLSPINGATFAGPPGTGKTLMAEAVAGETDATFYNVDMGELMNKYVGETEEHIRAVYDHAADNAPAIVFLDEADTATPDRDAADKEHSKSQTTSFLRKMDGFGEENDVYTLLSTNKPDTLDDALRSGRSDRTYRFDAPDRHARAEILDIHVADVDARAAQDARFGDLPYGALAWTATGATGADLENWVESAVRHAAYGDTADLGEAPSTDTVTTDDFLATLDDMPFYGPVNRVQKHLVQARRHLPL